MEASYFYYRPSDLTWEGNLKEVITLIRVLMLSLSIDQKIIVFPILQLV
jgi:hypothetical protein